MMPVPKERGKIRVSDADRPIESVRKTLRPKDAATLILIDRSACAWRVLMGKRSAKHVFMPGTYVFPGGRRDRRDHALPFETDLHPSVMSKLLQESRGRLSAARARALALAALREFHEETGIAIGDLRPAGHLAARLSGLRYIARAITPPGLVRRFDTRFFSAFADEAGVEPHSFRDSHELQDLRWIDLAETDRFAMPDITRVILGDLRKLVETDPTLSYGMPVPFYFDRHRTFVRELF